MQDGSRRGGRLLAYLQLLRLPNVFTVVADVMMGFLFVRGDFRPWPAFAALLVASCAMYLAGMVLNDVYDLEVDRRERPDRPLSSGRVPLQVAQVLGWTLLLCGWLLGVAISFFPSVAEHSSAAPALAASLLAVAIVAYDTWLKNTFAGPLVMGACRFLNVLLAMSLVRPSNDWPLIWSPVHFVVALAIGLHIAGVTWFAREEAGGSRRSTLAFGLIVMATGWVTLAWLADWLPAHQMQLKSTVWYFWIPILAVPLLHRLLRAIADPKPHIVQTAVRQGIWSLVWIDASIVLLVAPPAYALLVVALFGPMIGLGRWVYST